MIQLQRSYVDIPLGFLSNSWIILSIHTLLLLMLLSAITLPHHHQENIENPID